MDNLDIILEVINLPGAHGDLGTSLIVLLGNNLTRFTRFAVTFTNTNLMFRLLNRNYTNVSLSRIFIIGFLNGLDGGFLVWFYLTHLNIVALAHTHENCYDVMSKFLLLSWLNGHKRLTCVVTTFLLIILLTLVVILLLLFIIVVIFTLKELLEVVNDEFFLGFREHLGHL